MQKVPALIAAAGLIAVTLTACSSGPAACTDGAKPGDTSDLVSVSGAADAAPTVDFPTPLKTATTERTVITPGHGEGIVTGQQVQIEMSIFNGTTGDLIQKTKYGEDETAPLSLIVSKDQVQAGLVKGLTCATDGSRIAVVVPPKDAFGDTGNESIGIGPGDNLVFVIDVVKTFLTRANGADQVPQNGFPSVVLDSTGRPGITIPSGNAPKKLGVAELKKGDGAVVKKGDSVLINYTGVVWSTKKVFDSSWERGTPVSLTAAPSTDGQDGVIEGFADALIGKTVGSQVIAVIPPDKAYGDAGQGAIPPNATLVFVVDILGIN